MSSREFPFITLGSDGLPSQYDGYVWLFSVSGMAIPHVRVINKGAGKKVKLMVDPSSRLLTDFEDGHENWALYDKVRAAAEKLGLQYVPPPASNWQKMLKQAPVQPFSYESEPVVLNATAVAATPDRAAARTLMSLSDSESEYEVEAESDDDVDPSLELAARTSEGSSVYVRRADLQLKAVMGNDYGKKMKFTKADAQWLCEDRRSIQRPVKTRAQCDPIDKGLVNELERSQKKW